jgi:hypothetical protein
MSARRWPLEKIMPGTKMRPVLFLNHHMQSACVVYLLVCIRAAAGVDSSVHVACAPHCHPGGPSRHGIRRGAGAGVCSRPFAVVLDGVVGVGVRRCWHSSLLAFVVVGARRVGISVRPCWRWHSSLLVLVFVLVGISISRCER